jgi:hypothetical protein
MTETDIRQDMDDAYWTAIASWQRAYTEMKKDLRYAANDQWDAQQKARLLAQRRHAYTFNRIRRVIKLVTGYQRKNRLALRVDPVEGSDDQAASQLGEVLMWVMQHGNGYGIMSDGFEQGALKAGLGLVEPFIDYSKDPVNGDIGFRFVPFTRFVLDPSFSRRDLGDCGYIIRREYHAKGSCKAMFPRHAREIERLQPQTSDGKFTLAPASQLRNQKNLLRYDEFWRREYEKRWILVDETGRHKVAPKGTPKQRIEMALRNVPGLHALETYVQVANVAIFIEGVQFYNGPDPLGIGDYPFVPLIGFYDAEYDDMAYKIQGLVRCMRDPQTEANKRRSQMIDILETQINSGWVAPKKGVENPEALYQSGQGVVIWLDENTPWRPQKIEPGQIPAGMFQLQQVMDKDILEIPGANSDLMGQPENENIQVAGILSKLRQGQGLTVLQDLFDHYRETKKLLGSKLMRIVQENFTPAKVQRIINKPVRPQLFDKETAKYDVVPTEGVLTDTQRQMYYLTLRELKGEGAPIPWSAILDAAPMPNKAELKDQIAKYEQAMAQSQSTMEQLQQAQLMEDLAQAQERRSADIENRANAALDRVKALKELEKMDMDKITGLVDMLMKIDQGYQKPRAAQGGRREMTRR